jgi:hypothetical protein
VYQYPLPFGLARRGLRFIIRDAQKVLFRRRFLERVRV